MRCSLVVFCSALGAFAMEDAPNATHAWGLMGDFNQPCPFAVKVCPCTYPSDAIGISDVSKVSAKIAADAQLHFAAKGAAKLVLFGADALSDVAARPGVDGWIVYDVVFHRPGEGHDGILTVFVNGLFAKDVSVAKAEGATPLVLSGTDLCDAWIRPTPAPWANKLYGRYADKEEVRKCRAATAARRYLDYLNIEMRPNFGSVYFRVKKLEAIIEVYTYCQDEPYKTAFETECAAMLALIETKDSKVSTDNMITFARSISPLQKQGIVPKDYPIVEAMKKKGVKSW